jgi:hypothetical protein
MANTSFTIELMVKGAEIPEELKQRASDLSVFFENIIDEWAKHNKSKFYQAKGAEQTGIGLDIDNFWFALTDTYRERKHKTFSQDWLMVATGELMITMTNPEGFMRMVTPTTAFFGTPWNEEDEMKVKGNWERRQVIFIDKTDEFMIKQNLQNYFSLGENYKNILFARGLQQSEAKRAVAKMDIDWQGTIGGGA